MKSIVVHLDASPRSAVRIALAQALARRHQAELTAFYAVLPAALAVPWAFPDAPDSAAALLADLDRDQRERARQVFDDAARQAPLRWEEAADGAIVCRLAGRAMYSDLLVLGQPDPADAQAGALPPDLVPGAIADSGRPALVIPRQGGAVDPAAAVLVAWKPTREAARAVSAALPWLREAGAVHLACQPDEGGASLGSLRALRHWLALSGVDRAVEEHVLRPGDTGAALLALAQSVQARLLVMGCYGHSRAREWVLGGVTRTVLDAMTLPVLMTH